ncbi:MAG: carboxymuconolactone decarboxylase family protein [Burkholderiales bacterium]|nr:carboxymuconolactone decarboxylase family protein [Burkholderiales bacterium]
MAQSAAAGARGANPAAHGFGQYEWLARMDPAYDEARRRLADRVWTPENPALAVEYREIIAAVILGYRTYPSVESHLRRALAEGATLREILEGFEAAAVVGGFTMLHFTLPYFIKLHEEFGDDVIDGAGRAASTWGPAAQSGATPTGGSSTAPVSRGMREWAWLDKVDPGYDGARRHLTSFVWTPNHPALPVRIRELAAAAVLAFRAFPTLDGHLRRAVREGASMMELVEAMEAAALPGGFPVLHYALPFLMKLHDEIEAGAFKA